MGSMSLWHWIIVLAVVLLLFGGRGKVSQLMGDFGKGLQAFTKGINGAVVDSRHHCRPVGALNIVAPRVPCSFQQEERSTKHYNRTEPKQESQPGLLCC